MSEGLNPEEAQTFAGIAQGLNFGNMPAEAPYSPYGTPVATAKNGGMTRRGKMVFAVAGVAMVCTCGLWWTSHQAAQAEAEKAAVSAQVELKRLELEEARIRNEQQTTDARQHNTAQAAVQERIDACVDKGVKSLDDTLGGPTRSSVIADCRQQYETVNTGDAMAPAGSATDTPGSAGGGMNTGALLGLIGGVALVGIVGARRGRKADAQ